MVLKDKKSALDIAIELKVKLEMMSEDILKKDDIKDLKNTIGDFILECEKNDDLSGIKAILDEFEIEKSTNKVEKSSFEKSILTYSQLDQIFYEKKGKDLYSRLLDLLDDSTDFDICGFIVKTKDGFETHIKNNSVKSKKHQEYFLERLKSNYEDHKEGIELCDFRALQSNESDLFNDYACSSAPIKFRKEVYGCCDLMMKKNPMMHSHMWLQSRLTIAIGINLLSDSYVEKLSQINNVLAIKNQQLNKEKFLSDERDHAFERLLRVAYDPQDVKFKNEIKGILKKALDVDASCYIMDSEDEVESKIENRVTMMCELLNIKYLRDKILNSVHRFFLAKSRNGSAFSLENGEILYLSCVPIKYFSFEEEKSDISIGTLIVVRRGENPSFLDRENSFLDTISDLIGIITEYTSFYREHQKNKEMMFEFNTAENIQKNLLPKEFPFSNVFEIYGTSQSYKYVGGDFYNVFRVAPGKLGCVVGDVCGKGIPAALMANLVWSQFMTISGEFVRDTKLLKQKYRNIVEKKGEVSDDELLLIINSSYREAMTNEVFIKLNNKISEFLDDYSFVTMVYLIFDEKELKLELSNAGHMPVILCRAEDNTKIHLGLPSPPIGLEPNLDYPRKELKDIRKGDVFVVYTDGVVEARLAQGGNDQEVPIEERIYGIERLENLVMENSHKSAKVILELIMKSIQDFSGDQFSDDVTLVVFKIKE
ncbi:serine/threonine-protein phosphatase [bacterium]|nr:serine/threonine-protein phosphatase [bacterium]